MTEINYSYSINAPSPAPAPRPEDPRLWSFTGVELTDLENGLTRLTDSRDGKQVVVQREVGIVLTYCENFKTLREHAEFLVSTLPQLDGQVEPIIPVLEQMRDAGFMRNAADMLEGLMKDTNKGQLAPVRVFIITCDRPEAVERLLASLEKSGGLSVPESYWLIDDSRKPNSLSENQRLVHECNARGALSVNYFGPDERQVLLKHLAESVPHSEDSLNILLSREPWDPHPTYGISRTFATLLSAGYRAVILDDDVLCQAIRPPIPGKPVRFGSINGREAVFYTSKEHQSENARRMSDNPVVLMARQLGADLSSAMGSLLHGSPDTTILKGANGAFLRSITPNSPIVCTQCSTWGDPGTGDNHWVSQLDYDSVSRLLNSDIGISDTVDARCVWLGQPTPTFTKNGVMSQITGYDATRLLPPFLPAFRGEDAIFALMLAGLHPEGLILNHNWAIAHSPIDQRRWNGLKGAIGIPRGFGLLSQWLLETCHGLKADTPVERLQEIASALRRLSDLSEEAIFELLRELWEKAGRQRLANFHRQQKEVARHNSKNWSAYIDRGCNDLESALAMAPDADDLLGVPTENIKDHLELGRSMAKRLADALEQWPDIWVAAQSFKL